MSGEGVKTRGPVIAIDGPSGVGKTTVSKLVAGKLGFSYVDTGAMYRAVAVGAVEAGVDIESDEALREFCKGADIRFENGNEKIFFGGEDYTRKIREPSAGAAASRVSPMKPVREFLVGLQRGLGAGGNVVMEGRDIGTVVFPDADVKIYLDAAEDVRAGRRHRELEEASTLRGSDIEEVKKAVGERDMRDSRRENSPLKKAEDAVLIDTGGMKAEEVAARILAVVKERLDVGDSSS
ncbi:MAG: (d)CMP kinase [Thermodesulfobacteriota bacterium]